MVKDENNSNKEKKEYPNISSCPRISKLGIIKFPNLNKRETLDGVD